MMNQGVEEGALGTCVWRVADGAASQAPSLETRGASS
jgi:hypothetical protein